jgi:hypothetical protein
MPICTRRVAELGASLVWRVERTRCPVCAAWKAISAVSRSRISPTMTTLGSCRKIERRPAAKVIPAFSETATWLMPPTRYSMGSSTVTMLVVSDFKKLRAA